MKCVIDEWYFVYEWVATKVTIWQLNNSAIHAKRHRHDSKMSFRQLKILRKNLNFTMLFWIFKFFEW